jgi:hypothetical protein
VGPCRIASWMVGCIAIYTTHYNSIYYLLYDRVLPLRRGGLGLSCTSPAEGSAAYLAAAATTHKAMLNGPEAFRPFDGPSGVQLRTQWASLHGQAGTLWPPEYQEVSSDSLGTIASAQHEFSRHTAQTCAEAMLESFDPNTTEGRCNIDCI